MRKVIIINWQIFQLKALAIEKPIFWYCCIQIFNSYSFLFMEYSHNLPSLSYHLIPGHPWNDIFVLYYLCFSRKHFSLSSIAWLCYTCHFNHSKSKGVEKKLTWFSFTIIWKWHYRKFKSVWKNILRPFFKIYICIHLYILFILF